LNDEKNKTCHLVLKHKWYDLIEKGEKTVEYRDDTPYWRARILGCDRVTFHRGYTKTTMTFEITFKSYGLFALVQGQIEIHLGKRIE